MTTSCPDWFTAKRYNWDGGPVYNIACDLGLQLKVEDCQSFHRALVSLQSCFEDLKGKGTLFDVTWFPSGGSKQNLSFKVTSISEAEFDKSGFALFTLKPTQPSPFDCAYLRINPKRPSDGNGNIRFWVSGLEHCRPDSIFIHPHRTADGFLTVTPEQHRGIHFSPRYSYMFALAAHNMLAESLNSSWTARDFTLRFYTHNPLNFVYPPMSEDEAKAFINILGHLMLVEHVGNDSFCFCLPPDEVKQRLEVVCIPEALIMKHLNNLGVL